GVVDDGERPAFGLGDRGQDRVEVHHVERGIGGRLEPQQIHLARGRDPGRRVGGFDAPDGELALLLGVVECTPRAGVAVDGHGDGGARGQQVEDGGDGGHAGGERRGGAAFEGADRLFERRPRGRADLAGVVESQRAGGDERDVGRLSVGGVGTSGEDGAGTGRPRIVHVANGNDG